MLRARSDAQLSALAEAGRRLGHLDRMVNSAERAKTNLDFAQRFPMPFINESRPVAEKLQLDPNWVYGLIRQESRFIADVRSGVGAKGLMQIMPATGAWMAKRIDYPNYSTDRLNDPVVNLAIGQHYLATVLTELDNSPILATAAYNAGPGRSRTWLAHLEPVVFGIGG